MLNHPLDLHAWMCLNRMHACVCQHSCASWCWLEHLVVYVNNCLLLFKLGLLRTLRESLLSLSIQLVNHLPPTIQLRCWCLNCCRILPLLRASMQFLQCLQHSLLSLSLPTCSLCTNNLSLISRRLLESTALFPSTRFSFYLQIGWFVWACVNIQYLTSPFLYSVFCWRSCRTELYGVCPCSFCY